MNKNTTLIGTLLALGLIIFSIATGGAGIGGYIDFGSILIVVGGTVGTALMVFNMEKLKNLINILKIAFTKTDADRVEELYQIINIANKARKNGGLLSIQSEIENLDDKFLQKGLMLIIDNTDPEILKSILSKEIESTASRHLGGQDILGFMAESAPAMGMIGTLVGLVAMLQNLSDSAAIGPSMAVALLTTLYGALLANVIFIPLAKKLEKITEEEVTIKEASLEGILGLQAGEGTSILEEKLKAYLNNDLKKALEERKSGDK